ncbi:hypothetical protein CMO92_00360, partial [Candidatus Woesearchaeota archaeon]|nr:hypothetical protein [Candidatus Woesearchaeota archaeon]
NNPCTPTSKKTHLHSNHLNRRLCHPRQRIQKKIPRRKKPSKKIRPCLPQPKNPTNMHTQIRPNSQSLHLQRRNRISNRPRRRKLHPAIPKVDYLIIEGDFDFVVHPDIKIYFHVPDDLRLQNRINRDKEKRNEPNVQNITENFNLRQKLQYIPYTLPAAKKAHLIIIVTAEQRADSLNYTYALYKKK